MSIKIWQNFSMGDQYIYINRTRIKKVFANQIQFIDNELINFNNAKKLVKKISCDLYNCNENYIICSKAENDYYKKLLKIEIPSTLEKAKTTTGKIVKEIVSIEPDFNECCTSDEGCLKYLVFWFCIVVIPLMIIGSSLR